MSADYEKALIEAAQKHGRLRGELAIAEAERDDTIRSAHRHGGLTVRAIAGLVGMSHQRVGQIVARDSADPKRANRRPTD